MLVDLKRFISGHVKRKVDVQPLGFVFCCLFAVVVVFVCFVLFLSAVLSDSQNLKPIACFFNKIVAWASNCWSVNETLYLIYMDDRQ